MNPTAAVMKIHLRYVLTLLYLPWIITLSSLLINLFVAYIVKEGFYTGGIMTIFVFMFVSGIVIPAQTFPFALDLSLRRKDYFKGTLSIFLLTSILTAVLLTLFSFLENITGGFGAGIHFFSLLDAFSQNPFWQFWIFFILLLFNFMFGLLIASLFQRFGKNGMYVFFSVLVLLLTVLSLLFTYFQWWVPFFSYLAGNLNTTAVGIFIISLLLPVFSYGLLRRASI
ncbi:hypothetical protein GKZ89_02610 [Bacillus mangrovi]|uniref:Uncharacterized protein n=1 Tax=Metabacillus mangrovi TaxID=1491830 RepID=A0A7X2S324_9BACI|nr:hypothetical protein [Metabacillus mangrovi]MTH52283.1 hypothetical protein [Metabacillus mangrovi]